MRIHGQSAERYQRSKYNEFTVTRPCQLMEFLMEAFHGASRSKIKAILQGNGVSVDNRKTTQFNQELQPGMVVRVTKHKSSMELNSPYVKIVYEDKYLLVIEKAPGILSMGSTATQFSVKTVLNDYFKRRRQKCTAHVVHRLDRDTSGLMIYAKDMKTEQILENNWHEIVTDRRYIAVVSGRLEPQRGSVESWLKDNKAFVTFSSPVDNGGKYALTHYNVLKSNDKYSLVDLKLETGRKNQIRVHMQDLGHPVLGDIKYGDGVNPLGRLALHAYRIFFTHPITGEPMRFETSYPTTFKSLLQ